MKKLLLALGLLALTGCATTRLSPNDRAQRASTLFDQLDTNHDGYLTRAELAAGLRYAGSPELNPNLVLGLKNDSKRQVRANRKLTEAEIKKAMAEAFDTRDAQLDNRITKEEFKKVVVKRSEDDSDGQDPWEPFME